MLESKGTSPITQGVKFIELLKRPQIDYRDLAQFDENAPSLEHDIIDKLEINIKYEGYIKTQTEKIEQMKRLEKKQLPTDIDYKTISGLRLEAQEKLNKYRPLNRSGRKNFRSQSCRCICTSDMAFREKTWRELNF